MTKMLSGVTPSAAYDCVQPNAPTARPVHVIDELSEHATDDPRRCAGEAHIADGSQLAL